MFASRSLVSCVCSRDGGGAVLRPAPAGATAAAADGAETLPVVGLATATSASAVIVGGGVIWEALEWVLTSMTEPKPKPNGALFFVFVVDEVEGICGSRYLLR